MITVGLQYSVTVDELLSSESSTVVYLESSTVLNLLIDQVA